MTKKWARQLEHCGLVLYKVNTLLCVMMRPFPGPTQPLVLSALRVVSLGVIGQGMTPTIHLCPVSRFRQVMLHLHRKTHAHAVLLCQSFTHIYLCKPPRKYNLVVCHDISSVNFVIFVDAQVLALLPSSPFLISSHVPLTTSFPYTTHYVLQARTATILKF